MFMLGNTQRVDVDRRQRELQERGRDVRLAMAREIHDTLSRTLTVINVQATAGSAMRDLSALGRIRELSGGSIGEVRGLVASLRASADNVEESAMDADQLVAAMGRMLGGFREVGLHIDTVFPVGEDRDLLVETESTAVQFTVYRIIGESLTNVLRHQGVDSRVIVTAMPDMAANTLHMRVESWSGRDGLRPPAVPVPGAGLAGMRDRVELLGGVFRWYSGGADSSHFVVEAELPVVLPSPNPRRGGSRPGSVDLSRRRSCAG